jgi:threonine synthase
MHYYSTERHSGPVDFKEATVTGQAPDGGLFYSGPFILAQRSAQSMPKG